MKLYVPLLVLLLCLPCVAGCKPEEQNWRPFEDEETVHINISQEARELLNQFPLVQILDEHLDLTTNVVWFKVRDYSGREFVLFYRFLDGKWIRRTDKPDGSYSFEEYNP